MKTNDKLSRMIWYGVSILCLAGIVACLICDLAINRALTWSLYPVYSIPFFWLLLLPLLLSKRYWIELTLAVLSVGALPYLYLIEKITPVTGWFMPLALPTTLSSIIAIWLAYLVFRFLPLNLFYKTALIVAVFGIGLSVIADLSVARFLSTSANWLQMILNMLATTAIAVICCFFGYRKSHPKASQ